MVDDAHGIGVLGGAGGGTLDALGLSVEQVPILMGTLGKDWVPPVPLSPAARAH